MRSLDVRASGTTTTEPNNDGSEALAMGEMSRGQVRDVSIRSIEGIVLVTPSLQSCTLHSFFVYPRVPRPYVFPELNY